MIADREVLTPIAGGDLSSIACQTKKGAKSCLLCPPTILLHKEWQRREAKD